MDVSWIDDGLYVASHFYHDLSGLPPKALVLDLTGLLLDDDSDQELEIKAIAQATELLVGAGADVVLQCDAGRNRSCVVAAQVLMHWGVSAEEAIDRIRKARAQALAGSGGALTNRTFVDYIVGHDRGRTLVV